MENEAGSEHKPQERIETGMLRMSATGTMLWRCRPLVEQRFGRLFDAVKSILIWLVSSGFGWTARWASATDVKQMRQRLSLAERALQTQSQSIALTSHELRTPLNGIIGLTELLDGTPLRAEQRSYLDAIATSARALLTLVDDLLDEGKIAAGHWRVNPKPVAIAALVEEVVELLAPRAQAKGLELAAHVARHVPDTVSIDPNLLLRILMNLIGNAIKFTQRGGIAIDVSVGQTEPHAVELLISVSDTGIGIAPEDQARVFAAYEQAEQPTGDGTGLGLAISRTIAHALGGTLLLTSEPGNGSTFCFKVPVPRTGAETETVRPFSGRQILLVSDRLIEPGLLVRRLFDLGASVELARDLFDARERFAAGARFDALLIDYDQKLPAEDLLIIGGANHPPMAVMMTPADRMGLEKLRAYGVETYLVKPIRTTSLVKVLATLMDGETLSVSTDEAVARPSAKPREPHRPTEGLRILLADDNDINVLLARGQLQAFGSLDIARNGAEAVALAMHASPTPYDVIIMDLHMPVMDGFTAIAAIRQSELTSGHRSYIVALTADVTQQSAAMAMAAGADATLTKPIDQARLGRLMLQMMRCHDPTRPELMTERSS